MLQSSHLEDHMKTIGVDQSLCTRSSSEHKCMNNIKNICQYAGNCYDQQNLEGIIDAAMVSTQEGLTDNSPNVPMTSTPVKKRSAGKSLCLFTNILDTKPKIEKRRIVDAKSKLRAMEVGTIQWTKKNEKGIQKSMSRSNVICMHV